MTDEEIFDLADDYGAWQDDFGRWNFQPNRLVSFALAMSEKNVRVSDKWVGLTDDEVMGLTCECVDDGTFNMDCAYDFARAIENSLKEKNND